MRRDNSLALTLALSAALALLAFGCKKDEKQPQQDGAVGQLDGAAPGTDGGVPTADRPPGSPDSGGVPKNRFACPIDKPQKVYGWALNAPSEITSDETWTPDNVYLVFGPFHVKAMLTIQAGTSVCFDYGPPGAEGNPEPPPGEMRIEQGGTLKVMGTADRHVVFSQKNMYDQYWGGIYFASGSKTDATTMQYLDFYNAGLSAAGPPIGTFPDPTQAGLDMQNVTFYSLQRKGLENLFAGFTAASRVVVNNYASETPVSDLYNYPVLRLHPYGAKTVTEQSFTLGADVPKPVRYVQLDHAEGALIDKPVGLGKLQAGFAWRNIGGMKVSGTPDAPGLLKIEPGAVVAVNNDGNLYIAYAGGSNTMGNLQAVGTKDNPIRFTSDSFIRGEEPKPGDWGGILFFPGSFQASVSKFDYVTFEYGGGGSPDTIYNCHDGRSDVGAELLFTNSGTGENYDGPAITNSTFRASAAMAVRDRCNVNNSGGCLKTNYMAPTHKNTFEGFSDPPAQFEPLSCTP